MSRGTFMARLNNNRGLRYLDWYNSEIGFEACLSKPIESVSGIRYA